MVKMWVANTDLDWFDFLASQPNIEKVNFWRPSGRTQFGAIQPGELFLFKKPSLEHLRSHQTERFERLIA